MDKLKSQPLDTITLSGYVQGPTLVTITLIDKGTLSIHSRCQPGFSARRLSFIIMNLHAYAFTDLASALEGVPENPTMARLCCS